MKMSVNIGGLDYAVDLAAPHAIAIPVRFGEGQVSAFGAPPAQKETYAAGDFTGNVARGGSCNCETYTITPHCNGTHTECVGHITAEAVYIDEVLRDSFMPATLVSVTAEAQGEDLVITRAALERALGDAGDFLEALVVRTLPNDAGKASRVYEGAMPPYFSADAMQYITDLEVQHLLVDMPSVDRLDDGGRLANHRIFWGVAPGETAVAEPSNKTITELIYAPDDIPDGAYLLNLQVAAFKSDAAPSRPILYQVRVQ